MISAQNRSECLHGIKFVQDASSRKYLRFKFSSPEHFISHMGAISSRQSYLIDMFR